jgi:hypothetical protein
MSNRHWFQILLCFAAVFPLHADRDSVERILSEAESSLVEIAPGAGCVEFNSEYDQLYRGDLFRVLQLDNEYSTELQQSQFRKTAEYREYAALLTKLRKHMEALNFCLPLWKSEYNMKRRGFIVSSGSALIHSDIPAEYARAHNEIWDGVAMKLPGARRVTRSLEAYYETLLPLPEDKALLVEKDGNCQVYAVFRIKGVARFRSQKYVEYQIAPGPAIAEFIRGEFIRFTILNKESGEIYY